MKLFGPAIEGFSRWIDVVANALVGFGGRFSRPRVVELVEGEGGTFTVRTRGKAKTLDQPPILLGTDGHGAFSASPAQGAVSLKGSRAEIVLQPNRFIFRQIELPRRASEFLDGIVRSQIDRLTPWNAAEAVFGCAKPTDIANDKIALTVAATSRAMVMPYVQAVSGLGADSVTVSTVSDDPTQGGAAITVLEQKGRGAFNVRSVHHALVAILLIVGLAAGLSVGAAVMVAEDLSARQDDLVRRLVSRRAALRTALDAESDSALARLERRKHENPSSVIVIEALSKVLPDHTFVTELRIESNKIQVIGVTRDAPSLIRLIEQSSHFTHATFFAPTTRSPSDPGDRFHIEARVQAVMAPRT
jgi:general secretion pathway protein L